MSNAFQYKQRLININVAGSHVAAASCSLRLMIVTFYVMLIKSEAL